MEIRHRSYFENNMVVMFVDCCVCGLRYFRYYSYSRNTTGREFFDRATTLITVNLLTALPLEGFGLERKPPAL